MKFKSVIPPGAATQLRNKVLVQELKVYAKVILVALVKKENCRMDFTTAPFFTNM